MTNQDNVIYARFNMKEECERHWKDGCEVGLKFGYRYGYAEGIRERTKKIAQLLSVLLTVAVVYYGAVMITMLAYMVIQQDLSQ